MSQDEMNAWEIGRTLARLEEAQKTHGEKLDEIKEQTMKTNGFVGRHEVRLDGLDRELRDFKRGSGHSPTPPSLPAEPGESFSVKISPAMWKLIAAGAGAIGAMLLQKLGGS